MRTTDTVTLSDSEFAALSYLVKHGPVFSSDIDYPMKWDFIFLKEHKLSNLSRQIRISCITCRKTDTPRTSSS